METEDRYVESPTGQICHVEYSNDFQQMVGHVMFSKTKGVWLLSGNEKEVPKPNKPKERMYCAMIPYPGIEIEVNE